MRYDPLVRKYKIEYRIANQHIISYLDGNSNDEELQDWQAFHKRMARSLAIKYITQYDSKRIRDVVR